GGLALGRRRRRRLVRGQAAPQTLRRRQLGPLGLLRPHRAVRQGLVGLAPQAIQTAENAELRRKGTPTRLLRFLRLRRFNLLALMRTPEAGRRSTASAL